MINTLLISLLVLLGQPPQRGIEDHALQVDGVGQVFYGISVPNDYDPKDPRPLVLALHPGGTRMRYYGSAYMRQVVAPGVRDLKPIIVAPDCPAQGWIDPGCERAAMALVQYAFDHYSIDRRRILVVGFSLGGRGTWFMSSHHSDVFTAAIPMAASTGDEPIDKLATMPTYVIHSRADQVVPFAPAERNARELEKLGRTIKFEALSDLSHYDMIAYVDALRRGARWVADRWKEQGAGASLLTTPSRLNVALATF
jgi:predicted peptidase